MWSIPTFSGKFVRFLEQFTPYSWRKFSWGATVSLKRWLAVLGIIFMVSILNLNPFNVTDLFLYPLKTSENLWFVMFSGGIEKDKWHKWVNQRSWKFSVVLLST